MDPVQFKAELDRPAALALRPALWPGRGPALAASDELLTHLAHELRTPLGQIGALADLIGERAASRLDPEERRWLVLQRELAACLLDRLGALLALAHGEQQALPREAVDLSALAASVIDELAPLARRAPVAWQVEGGLQADCNAALARVLLLNLLGNAAKFTRGVAAPVVGLFRAPCGGFVVEDNGVGFAPRDAARLFQPFVRLHGGAFEGTGVGLSLVRRIVERHGGHLGALGRSGAGARFEFDFGPPGR